MRNAFVCEAVESRKLFSASATIGRGISVVGESSGLTAQAVTPTFVALELTANGQAADGNALADLNSAIRLTISGGSGIDPRELDRSAVRLTDLTTGKVYRSSDNGSVLSELNRLKTTGGGDALIIQTKAPLEPNHRYRVEVNGSYSQAQYRVQDIDGNVFAAKTFEFKTGTYLPPVDRTIAFQKTVQSAAGNKTFTSTAIGPDHRLYAGTSDGYIYRYDIGSDGTLSNQFQINAVRAGNGGNNRIITGILFDPGSTASTMAIWVSHNQYRIGSKPTSSVDFDKSADNFSSKISVISGSNWQNYQDKIVGIPRSTKDHMVNQLVLDPAKKQIYFAVAAMNAMGDADPVWGNRVENIYSASIIRAQIGALNVWVRDRGPVNLAIDGPQNTATGLDPSTLHYNIYKGGNPVRLFATGIRNAYDMLFDRNGRLFANINGSSAGGNVPATPAFSSVPIQNRIDKDKYKDANKNYLPYNGPSSNSITSVPQVEEDTLLNVIEGKYYGHPNPSRGEYIFNGGNPTSAVDPFEIAKYPVGQQPDRNYMKPVLDYGTNFSPNGIIQYTSVGGKNKNLDGYLLSTRYSGGADILALKPNADGTIDESKTKERLEGFTDLGSPLDVVEDLTNGNLYVVSMDIDFTAGSITLLKPTVSTGAPVASTNPSKLGFYVKPGGSAATRSVTITNSGTADLVFDPTLSRVSGSGRRAFTFVNFPTAATAIPPGRSLTLNISAALLRGQTTTQAANLQLKTDDTTNFADGYISIPLRAYNANTTTA